MDFDDIAWYSNWPVVFDWRGCFDMFFVKCDNIDVFPVISGKNITGRAPGPPCTVRIHGALPSLKPT